MMPKLIYILNGPNLNLLGKRQPDIYGTETLYDVEEKCRRLIAGTELRLKFEQSNAEYQLIDWIHEARKEAHAIIINAAAYTHTSVGIADAIKSIEKPVVEVHISNTYSREEFRHKSFLSPNVHGIIQGFGLKSYELAIKSFL